MAKPSHDLIPASAYCRKSPSGHGTKGEAAKQRSLATQNAEIAELAKRLGYRIVRWYEDPRKSGWAVRPGFARMLEDAEKLRDVRAILCDNVDRFSRADPLEVQADALRLRKAGVTSICTPKESFEFGQGADLGNLLKFVCAVHAAHEYSRNLSFRQARSRRDKAKEELRSGGPAPYGLANDGKGGLKFGKASERRVVKRVFDEFVRGRSMNAIAASLNKAGIPARHGGRWYVATIKEMLQRRAYRGTFTYNLTKPAEFFFCNAKKDIVPSGERTDPYWKKSDDGAFIVPDKYAPLVEPALFDRAQARLLEFTMKGSRRPRDEAYALSRVLICDHCKQPLYGCTYKKRGYSVYRCPTNAKEGMGSCGTYEIREDLILPYVLQLLGESVDDLSELLTRPPVELRAVHERREEERQELEQQRAKLVSDISKGDVNLLRCQDERTRKSCDATLSQWRDELKALDARLSETPPSDGYSREEIRALGDWWEDFNARAVKMSLSSGKLKDPQRWFSYLTYLGDDPGDEPQQLLVGRKEVNEALHSLGGKVHLRWTSTQVSTSAGKTQSRHTLDGGRFQLGQKHGKIPSHALNSSAWGTLQ